MKHFTKTVTKMMYMCETCGKTSSVEETIQKHELNCQGTIENIVHHDGKYTTPSQYLDIFEFIRLCNPKEYGKPDYHLCLNINRQFTIGNKSYFYGTNNYYHTGCKPYMKLVEFENKYFAWSDDKNELKNVIYITPESLRKNSVVVTFKSGKTVKYLHSDYSWDANDDSYPINLKKGDPIIRIDLIDKPVEIKKSVETIKLDLKKPEHSVFKPDSNVLLIKSTSNCTIDLDLAQYWLKHTDANINEIKTIALTDRRRAHNLDDYLNVNKNEITHFQGSRADNSKIIGLKKIKGKTEKSAILCKIFNEKCRLVDFPDAKFYIKDTELIIKSEYHDGLYDTSAKFFNADGVEISFDTVYDMLMENDNTLTYTKYE